MSTRYEIQIIAIELQKAPEPVATSLAYERQDQLDRAIERYEQALEVTGRSSDGELGNGFLGPLTAAVSPGGELYIGAHRRTGRVSRDDF